MDTGGEKEPNTATTSSNALQRRIARIRNVAMAVGIILSVVCFQFTNLWFIFPLYAFVSIWLSISAEVIAQFSSPMATPQTKINGWNILYFLIPRFTVEMGWLGLHIKTW